MSICIVLCQHFCEMIHLLMLSISFHFKSGPGALTFFLTRPCMLRIARRENIGWRTSFRCFESPYVKSPKDEWSLPKASYKSAPCPNERLDCRYHDMLRVLRNEAETVSNDNTLIWRLLGTCLIHSGKIRCARATVNFCRPLA